MSIDVDEYWKTDVKNEDRIYPSVDLVSHTESPVQFACLSARGDYSTEYVYDQPYIESMESVEGDELSEKEENLLKKCIARGHYGIFEHINLILGVERMSRVCMAQITRHRLVSFDVQSMRFVDFSEIDEEDFYSPPSFENHEAKTREGVSEIDPPSDQFYDTWKEVYQNECENLAEIYQKMVDSGMPKEYARMILPLGTRVNCTMSMNLRSFFHLLEIRGAGDAQNEVNFLMYNAGKEFVERMPFLAEIYFENAFMKPKRLAP